jgi:HK97 family phage portal protein
MYWQGTVFGGGGPNSAAGMLVNPDRAMTLSAVYACLKVLGEDTSTLPFDVFRRTGADAKEPVPSHPLYDLIHDQPNPDQTAQEWREEMTVHAAARGAGYSRIIPGRRGFVDQLVTIPPETIRQESLPGGDYRYRIRNAEGREEVVLKDEVFELRGFLRMSVVGLARETIGSALAAEQFAGATWRNGAKPSGVLKHKGTLSAGAQERLRGSFDQRHAGANNGGRPIVLEEGMDWAQVQISNEDMQFIESRYFSIEEVCRWFRMQPHKIAHLLRATFSNIEEQNIEHGSDTIRPWCVRWEQAVKRQLLLGGQYFAEHNMDALLRGNTLAQNQGLMIERQMGVRNANEIRTLKNLNPRTDPGGTAYWDTQPGVGSGAIGTTTPTKARALAENAARGIVARERAAVSRNATKFAADYDGWQGWCRAFFEEHATVVAEKLALSQPLAHAYCEEKCNELIADGLKAVERWEARDIPQLAELALGGIG